MFDWNDEELTNIIWGEAGASDDHIVPYQEGSEDYLNKKEWSRESATIKPTEQKTPGAKGHSHGRKLESNSNFNTDERISASGFGMGSWPGLSLSNAAKTDQDSLGSEVSNNLAEITKYNSTSGETAEHDKNPGNFQNPQQGKEQGDFVDYSWANIGSFDDLDRILSNEDPIFGHVSLDSVDELWSSSKDVTNCPVKSLPITADSPSFGLGALRNASELLEIKTEYEQPDDPSFTLSYAKMNDPASHGPQNAQAILDPGGKSKPTVKEQADLVTGGEATALSSCLAAEKVATPNEFVDKASRQKKLLKYRKKSEEKSETKLLQDLYGSWTPSGQYENQLAPSIVQNSPSSILSQQRQLQGSDTLQYQHISSPFVVPSAYGNLTNTYPMMPVLSHIHSREFKHRPLLSDYELSPGNANPVNKSADTPAKSLTMTPQEKIEKLRRRQQMQAMLAIQKQQQQFGHKVSCSDHSITQKCPQDNQIQIVEGAALDGDDLSALPLLDPNSPLEQDDFNTISVAIDDSVEDTVLYRLEDVIAKLDIRIRLCVRDSLFRLAQSAMQRHYASDTSSTNKSTRDEHEVVAKEETDRCTSDNIALWGSRYAKMPDAETETNPIDRIMAHLLFHRPLDLTGKHPETPESPDSTKIPFERKKGSSVNLQMGCMLESSKIKQNFSHQGSKTPCPLGRPQFMDQLKNSPNIDTSENASNYGPADDGAVEVEASQ